MKLSLFLHLLLFLSVSSHEKLADPPGQFMNPKVLNVEKHLGPHEKFEDPFGNPVMHTIVLPNCDNVLMYAAAIWWISNIMLPNGECRILNQAIELKQRILTLRSLDNP
ncbi:hypothetical protein LINPERPRIM_LOCUS19497 [Linum perenne]